MAHKLYKSAVMTDIHFGKKSNSPQHNKDCLDYIDWFCDQVKKDKAIDHVLFLGDWHENRSSLNVSTLNESYRGISKLNELGIPIFFCVGNHDLLYRHTREVYSVVHFQGCDNVVLIDSPTVVEEIGDGVLLCPFLFPDEYLDLTKYAHIPVWAGHFEFKGFVITGYNVTMPHGPDPDSYAGPKHILCGHFHKRQTKGNITYVGNAFPMDFGDTGDTKRGMATLDHKSMKLSFIDWPDCPKYIKVQLSDVVNNNVTIPSNARVKCITDIPLTYEESVNVKQRFADEFKTLDVAFEETTEVDEVLTDTEVSEDVSSHDTIDDLVIKMLTGIKSDKIDSEMLITIYRGIPR